MSRAIVYEPAGSNDTPLKYTAGLVLAVPVDCDLINIRDISLVRVAIRTPDQKVGTNFVFKRSVEEFIHPLYLLYNTCLLYTSPSPRDS